jgi:MFS family permease
LKKDISILLGNALDRFDTSLYGFLAPVMGPIFFPHHDPIVQLMLTYATSFTSLFSRPLGTFIFGMLARYKGPVFGLSYSLIGVGVTTVIIGCIPSYATIGWMAPVSLVVIRLVRGICAAGESTIAKLYILENKSHNHARIVSHFYQSSSMLGIIMASLVATVVIGIDHAWWRVCFVMGGATAFVGCYIRSYENNNFIQKSEIFDKYTTSNFALLWHNRADVLRVAITNCFSHITYAVPFVFMNSFVPLITTITLKNMMVLNTTLLVFDMIFIPVVGHIVHTFSARKVMICASGILAITVVPLFAWLPGASLAYVTCVRMWIVVWGLVFLCPLHFWCNSLFVSHDKYFLVGMGNALGAATLGHVTTPICLWLWYVCGVAYAPALYVVVIMSLTAYAVWGSE